jgi:hypothetical protein
MPDVSQDRTHDAKCGTSPTVAHGGATSTSFRPSGNWQRIFQIRCLLCRLYHPLPPGALATPQLPAISSALILPCQEGVSFSPLWVPVLPAENHGVRFYPDLWDLGGL